MRLPTQSGADLIRDIDDTISVTPALWWLGHAGFVMRFANITFYLDPCFSDIPGRPRLTASPLSGDMVKHADMILASHDHPGHLDAASLIPMLTGSKRAKLILPRSAADSANAKGIPYDRMNTMDAGLRVEYFKDNLYVRIYAVPSAHPELAATREGGHPYLGYLIRFGRWTVYHAGDCAPYPDLAARLQPFNVSVALLPIGGRNFTPSQAAQLAADIGAKWVIPMHYGAFHDPEAAPDSDPEGAFVMHMLGHRPELRFRTFQVGEKWTVPED